MSQSLHRPKEAIRVLIVAGHNIAGESLKKAFSHARKNFTVETLTGSSHKIISELGKHKPDVALISDKLQDGSEAGFKVLKELRESQHSTSAIMLLHSSNPEFVVNAFRDGARGVFYSTDCLKALLKCIRTVHQGQIWAGNEDLEHLINALGRLKPLQFHDADGRPLLTRREEDVVRLVADGLKNREIAKKLNVAEHSIRNYLYRIFDKLGVSTRVELILSASNHRPHLNHRATPRLQN